MMDLLLVRHAIAFDPDPRRWPDDRERPLTTEGREAFRRAARGVPRIASRPELVLSSPYRRARQTARILERCSAWPRAETEEGLATSPNWPLLRERLEGVTCAALVGHEPFLGELASLLLSGAPAGVALEFKKGTIARIALADDGIGLLRGLWSPRVLRNLAS